MDLVSGLAVYALLWWWVFLMALPFGVRREESPEEGHDGGAPKNTYLWHKVLVATIGAGILWLAINWAVEAELFSFREAIKDWK